LRKDDYISTPRDSGYRGIHLIYRYQSKKKSVYNRFKVEIQLRSRLQHAWATAVETIDAFTGQALKGGGGKEDWKRFFVSMSAYIAIKEKTKPVANTPQNEKELKLQISRYAQKLGVEDRLDAYGAAIQALKTDISRARYYLLQLDTAAKTVSIFGYRGGELKQAEADYMETEKEGLNRPELDAVLVRVGSLAQLPRAYPNYFADTRVFIGIVREAVA
jgi:hypothetical protein